MTIYPAVKKLITPPSGDVVTLDEFKRHIGVYPIEPRIDTRPEATEKAETWTNRKFLEQTWVYYYDCLPDDFLIPGGYLKEVTQIEVKQKDGTSEVIDAGDYEIQYSSEFLSRVVLLGSYWPTTDKPGGYEITFTVGWQDAASVPPAIKRGILMIADEIYNGNIVEVHQMPKVAPMMSKYKVHVV